ncbi:MAG TPA: ABC transporter permease, partial [Opitutus sp.]|nr:ABC transporter permease [Opitutus sp.]
AHLETVAGLTHNFFAALNVSPLAGQLWPAAADEMLAKNLGVIISEALWERRFNRDPNLVGSMIVVNGVTLPVAAVVSTRDIPAHFIGDSDLWIALSDSGDVGNPWALTEVSRGAAWLRSWGTLRPGVALDQATANLGAVSSLIAQEHPSVHERGQLSATSLPRYLLRYDRATVVVSLTVLAIILATFLVAISNASLLASLQIFRRAVDFKIKSALGASRRQLQAEVAIVCAILGTVLVLASSTLSFLLLKALPWLGATALLPHDRSNLDLAPTLIATTMVVAACVALWLWVVQALALTTIKAETLVRDARHQGLSASISTRFLLLQGALSITLMFPAAIHLKSSRNTERLPLGFPVENLLIVDLDLRDRGHNPKTGVTYLRRLYAEFGNSPRFTAIGVAQRPPLEPLPLTKPFVGGERSSTSVGYSVIGPGYFDGLGVKLLGGRDFDFKDDNSKDRVVIINEAMAQKFWPGDNAVGRDVDLFPGSKSRIIGVVQNFRSDLLQDRQPVAFIPLTLAWSSRLSLYLRFNGPPAAAA